MSIEANGVAEVNAEPLRHSEERVHGALPVRWDVGQRFQLCCMTEPEDKTH